jgi:hypothetical protein
MKPASTTLPHRLTNRSTVCESVVHLASPPRFQLANSHVSEGTLASGDRHRHPVTNVIFAANRVSGSVWIFEPFSEASSRKPAQFSRLRDLAWSLSGHLAESRARSLAKHGMTSVKLKESHYRNRTRTLSINALSMNNDCASGKLRLTDRT